MRLIALLNCVLKSVSFVCFLLPLRSNFYVDLLPFCVTKPTACFCLFLLLSTSSVRCPAAPTREMVQTISCPRLTYKLPKQTMQHISKCPQCFQNELHSFLFFVDQTLSYLCFVCLAYYVYIFQLFTDSILIAVC